MKLHYFSYSSRNKKMLRTAVVFALVALATAAPFNPDLDFHWENFKKIYNKRYLAREEGVRRVIWEQNVASIIHHNLQADLGIHTYRKGLNEYVDMRPEEFVKIMNGYKRRNTTSKATSLFVVPYNMDLPENVDWREEGLVTDVKNQEQCGSCWAFSTTGSLEGQHMKKTGKLVSLSEQNLVDCSGPEGNNGCEGGLMDQAFDYVKINKGIDTEKAYPYIAQDGKCHYKKSKKGATCRGFVDVPSGDEDALKKAVAAVGPVSVAIDASHQTFMMYKGGIYSEPNCSTEALDHGVLVVGYGTENDLDYWLVKNSWGTTWGEDGYVRMTRNQDNQCGIATTASYPLV